MDKMIPIGVSNRHVHLSQEHLEKLFGEGHELTPIKDLSQPGQFACEEKVDLIGAKRDIKGVRILGPVRKNTQVEISVADGFTLGISAPVKESGDIEGTPGIKITGPKGEIEIDKGVLVAARHIHMNVNQAQEFGLKDKDVVSVLTDGTRGLVFNNVVIRVNDKYDLDMHIDIEEANAAGLKNGDLVKIIDKN